MSQHDYVLDNATGAAFRSDLNNALNAIVTNNSGASAPTTTFSYMFWVDTSVSPRLLKMRNAANDNWIIIGTVESDGFGSLRLSGGTMTGALLVAVGSLSAPGLAFAGDTNTGFYWISADRFAAVVNGVAVQTFDAASTIYATFNGTGAIQLPIGTTAQRPTGTNGLFRFNSDLGQYEGYAGGTWRGVGGGGGGAGFQWKRLDGTESPLVVTEYASEVALFSPGLSQELYAEIVLPQSYASGTPLVLYVNAYSPSTSNTILLKAQSTRIRPGTDAYDSTANQRITTNSALTNSVANQTRTFVLDITDPTNGTINSQTLQSGDIVKIRLYRDASDSDTADLRLVLNANDVKFS